MTRPSEPRYLSRWRKHCAAMSVFRPRTSGAHSLSIQRTKRLPLVTHYSGDGSKPRISGPQSRIQHPSPHRLKRHVILASIHRTRLVPQSQDKIKARDLSEPSLHFMGSTRRTSHRAV